MAVPSPLPEEERKPRSFAGRALEYIKPYMARGGGIILKLLGGWFAMRIMPKREREGDRT